MANGEFKADIRYGSPESAANFLNADCTGVVIWRLRYAAQIIEPYAQVRPDERDAVLRILNRVKSLVKDTEMKTPQ